MQQAAPEGSALEELLGTDELQTVLTEIVTWAREELLTWNVLLQFGLLMGALVPAVIFGPRLKTFISDQLTKRAPYGVLKRLANALATIATPIALWVWVSIFIIVLGALGQSTGLLEAGRSLLSAWIVVRLVTLVIQSPFWSKVAFYTIWPIMVLDAVGVLDDVVDQLQQTDIPALNLTLFAVVRAIIVFGLFFWLANLVGGFITSRINKVEELNPSLKALFAKILNLILPVVALLLALATVNFDFATLAFFGGAVGIGVGLGLQRVISNFAAGVTLLADKSIKPGDTIEVGDTFGWITKMNTRYVAVRTRDGTEHLIPNDVFINEGVINWSHDDRVVRLHTPFGTSYDFKDVRFIQKMAEEAALTVPRVLSTPKPRCNLIEFGDSSVNFDLRFWINDPPNGVTNVTSDVMMVIWERLHENNIEIPFPQRDLHIKSGRLDLPAIKDATDETG
ncbi:mechanosensitive ion channel [Aquisalinus flavus]|nr:mechanosensitive ion channel [Aquisalinus flavus]UNE49328.1 mechanosensitive ion channel [Aquisalinus flavus]